MYRNLGIFLIVLVSFLTGVVVNSVLEIDRPAVGLNESSVFPSHVNLSRFPIPERKRVFVSLLLPLIKKANAEVLKERAVVLKAISKDKLSREEERKLRRIEKKYGTCDLKELLLRVNTVPSSLVLAQGAIESGWGTSRFFTEANNVFGVYSFKGKNCVRAKGSKVCLKVYKNLYESVRDYIRILNTGWAYRKFRELRSQGADVYTLAGTLIFYSTKRHEYAELIKRVIVCNNLDRFDEPELAANGL